MSSLRRQIASRANGARSRGPVTAQGKRISSLNALAHGLLAQCVLLPGESEEGFRQTVDEYVARFAPVDSLELGFIEEMASSYWRMRRLWAIENNLWTRGMDQQSDSLTLDCMSGAFRQLAISPEFTVLHRYEARLHRIFQRALHNLLLLREENLPNEPRSQFRTPRGNSPLDSDEPSPSTIQFPQEPSTNLEPLAGDEESEAGPAPAEQHAPGNECPATPISPMDPAIGTATPSIVPITEGVRAPSQSPKDPPSRSLRPPGSTGSLRKP